MGNLWKDRRARAVHLLAQTAHAEEILTFYVGLTEVQESVAEGVRVADLSGLVQSVEGDFPRLRLEKLPLGPLALPFHNFLSRVAEFGTETIKDGAQALLSQDDDRRLEPLRAALAAWGRAASLKEEEEEEKKKKKKQKTTSTSTPALSSSPWSPRSPKRTRVNPRIGPRISASRAAGHLRLPQFETSPTRLVTAA